ncbi:hypothetical protein NC653_009041 [Populus alba x Populus x berolinensis]|uniref:Uncharacterized protein n=1 Tax=Populus alba x Populus x berolinensis TaxID=444605 RepID=A0AAD6R8A8_9ROSI|nr:hypothetical protein NC653_009041 [Populus alba x Populus x berolinensis]
MAIITSHDLLCLHFSPLEAARYNLIANERRLASTDAKICSVCKCHEITCQDNLKAYRSHLIEDIHVFLS